MNICIYVKHFQILKMLKPLAVAVILIFNSCSSTTHNFTNERERLAFGSCFHLTGIFSRLIYVLDSIFMTS